MTLRTLLETTHRIRSEGWWEHYLTFGKGVGIWGRCEQGAEVIIDARLN